MSNSLRFAELVGIYMGDGNLGKYPRCQYLRIYFNPKQKQYIKYVSKLLTKQFGKSPYERYRSDVGNIGVTYLEISLKNMDKYLGFHTGNKITNKIRIPSWIWRKDSYLIACLRGIFDTDGCLYITGGKYRIVNYSSHNPYLIKDLYNALSKLGFHPYNRKVSVEIGRISEVQRFFDIIKPANDNHYRFDTKPR